MNNREYTIIAIVSIILAMMGPVVTAQIITVSKIIDHSMSVDERAFQVTHSLKAASKVPLTDIVVIDYLPEELGSDGEPVNYYGEKRHKVILNLSGLNPGQDESLSYFFIPRKDGNFTIHSVITYHLLGETHELMTQKDVIITNTPQNPANNSKYMLLLLIMILCLMMIKIYTTRKKRSIQSNKSKPKPSKDHETPQKRATPHKVNTLRRSSASHGISHPKTK